LGKIFELAFTSLEAVREFGEEGSLSLFFAQVVDGILEHVNCVANLSVLKFLRYSATITVIFIICFLITILHFLFMFFVSFSPVGGSD